MRNVTTDLRGAASEDQLISDALVRRDLLPATMAAAIEQFRRASEPTGCLLLRGLPIGDLPNTPAHPTDPTTKDLATERLLVAIASCLGEPVGYEPEHGGSIVQNIVPVPALATRQTSTSSKVELMFHTEAAFHPHRPRYLLLFCLRGDPSAQTTISSIHAALPHLADDQIDILFQQRFRCAVDESYLQGRANQLGTPMAVLSGTRSRPTMVFDEDLMVGIDAEADEALRSLGAALSTHHGGVALEAGDMVILDNNVVVHGRSPFTPRFDGTDRWLQRTFVVDDLAPSATERQGRVITTVFGN
jgi:L-asparagine oxygenase